MTTFSFFFFLLGGGVVLRIKVTGEKGVFAREIIDQDKYQQRVMSW